MAAALELRQANRYRSRSATRVAQLLRALRTDVRTLVAQAGPAARDRLMALPGIGSHAADKIVEYVETGEVQEHLTLVASLPEGLSATLGRGDEVADPIALGNALPLARLLVEGLSQVAGVDRVAPGGALRRGCELVDRIELVAAVGDARHLISVFTDLEPVTETLETEKNKASVRLEKAGLVCIDICGCHLDVHYGGPAGSRLCRRGGTGRSWQR